MGDTVCFLISVLYEYNDTIIKCALKVKRGQLQGDCEEYPMEPENREQLHKLLPLHVQSCGKIVDVDTSLFEVADLTTNNKE